MRKVAAVLFLLLVLGLLGFLGERLLEYQSIRTQQLVLRELGVILGTEDMAGMKLGRYLRRAPGGMDQTGIFELEVTMPISRWDQIRKAGGVYRWEPSGFVSSENAKVNEEPQYPASTSVIGGATPHFASFSPRLDWYWVVFRKTGWKGTKGESMVIRSFVVEGERSRQEVTLYIDTEPLMEWRNGSLVWLAD